MVPEKLKYTEEHEWIAIDGDVATIGITDYAQGELGDIVFVELPGVGSDVTKDSPFGTIEAVKAVSDIFAPVSGTVEAINDVLENDPETINKSPYEDGWIIKIKMSDPSEADALLSADQYKEKIA